MGQTEQTIRELLAHATHKQVQWLISQLEYKESSHEIIKILKQFVG